MVSAMSKTGGASIASGLFSALGTKVIASLLGPGSVAMLQTLQQLRDGAVIVATANGKMALVQGASALEATERREYIRTVVLLFAAGILLIAVAMMAAPAEFVRWSRLPASSEPLLAWVAVTVALLTIFIFLTAILNALREIGKLALMHLISPVAAALMAWPVAATIRAGHPTAMAFFLAVPAAVAASGAAFALWSHRSDLRGWIEGAGRFWTWPAAAHFFSISGAMLASGLAATTVLLAVRGAITRQEDLAMTGQFDAAWNISMNHVTLILGSVQAYYLPSLSAAKDAQERDRQIRSMMIVAVLATAPAIVALAALKPLVVSLLYSHAFAASPRFLRWTLLGDYLKVSSWVLMTPMLAARQLGVFLALDLLTQAAFWGSAKALGRMVGPAESAAIGFFLSYAICLAACCAYARLREGFRFGPAGLAAWTTGLLLVTGASASSWGDGPANLASAAAWIAAATAVSVGFALYLRRREA
jgi:O-antigen/teichoic acid export membrane protein